MSSVGTPNCQTSPVADILYKIGAKKIPCSGGDCVASRELLELLNKGIARELQVSIQYMWQHILAKGIEGAVVENMFRDIAITEMKHAEDLAERLAFLNGVPTTSFEPAHVGHSLEEMLKENVQAEEEAIRLYKQTIQVASKEGDFVTRRLLEDILSNEEKHLGQFSKLLVGMTSPFTQP
jgi:bacterioferritin